MHDTNSSTKTSWTWKTWETWCTRFTTNTYDIEWVDTYYVETSSKHSPLTPLNESPISPFWPGIPGRPINIIKVELNIHKKYHRLVIRIYRHDQVTLAYQEHQGNCNKIVEFYISDRFFSGNIPNISLKALLTNCRRINRYCIEFLTIVRMIKCFYLSLSRLANLWDQVHLENQLGLKSVSIVFNIVLVWQNWLPCSPFSPGRLKPPPRPGSPTSP